MMAFPKLRFKNAEGAEFTSWVTSFIGDECKITTGNKDTQNKIDGGKYPFFVRSQTVERINTYSKDCEAILTSGDGVGVGKNYHYINGKFDFHQRVYCLYDFSNQLLGKYLYIYFSNYFFDRVKRLSAKNSVDSVRMDMISKMEIKLPSLVEQTKIASFLSAVDEKISQLTQKHQLLSQYKQGMMQKLFSQQIRFKADDGSEFEEWEEKQLGDVCHFINGRAYKQTEWEKEGTPVIRLQNLTGSGKEYYYSTLNLPDHQYCYNNDLLYMWSATFGPIFWQGEKAIFHYHIWKVEVEPQQLDKQYMYYLLDEMTEKMKSSLNGSTMLHVTKQGMESTKKNLPSIEEQTKIANFLSAIDQKIDVVSEQLEQAKLWKKGLLQQMFV